MTATIREIVRGREFAVLHTEKPCVLANGMFCWRHGVDHQASYLMTSVAPLTESERDALVERFSSARGEVVYLPPDPMDKVVRAVTNLAKVSLLQTVILVVLSIAVLLLAVTR